jgi:N-acetylglucosamine-6-sulfatase
VTRNRMPTRGLPIVFACLTLALFVGPPGPSSADEPPAITGLSLSRGPLGTKVIITGTRLLGATDIRFNGTRALGFTVDADNRITAVVPGHATSGPLAVITPYGTATSGESFTVTAPDIVLILTDDQTWQEIDHMPTVQSELMAKGMTFTNGFVVNPLCCPARATTLTGKYSHGTDIYDNAPPHGGFDTFKHEDGSTVATWLHGAGYRTAIAGKYLNGYVDQDAGYVAPGWDMWDAEIVSDGTTGGYYNYDVSVDGTVVSYGSKESDYSTDVLGNDAAGFISKVREGQPLFLDFTPHAPHKPATPPKRYSDSLPNLPLYRPPNFNQKDVAREPHWVKVLPTLSKRDISLIDRFRTDQYRTLLAVDDAVRNILDALAVSGRLSNSLIVFSSDNGLELGSHRWVNKQVPWDEAIRVPFIVRYDPLTNGTRSTSSDMVLNLDLAPTFADAAGVPAPGAEGMSLLPLLGPKPPKWRPDFLIEHWGGTEGVPAYCAVRSEQYKYVEYKTREEQLYDLAADPYELENRASDPHFKAIRDAMHQRLLELCSPPPPGFSP